MSASEMVHLRGGMVVPVAAYLAVLDLERAGHRLELDGEDILVIPAKASYPIDPDMLAALKRWKRHAIMLLNYTADDSHLHDRGRQANSSLRAPDAVVVNTAARMKS